MKTAPLGVARLAQTPGLGYTLRLDWHCFHTVRICKNSVNRPYRVSLW